MHEPVNENFICENRVCKTVDFKGEAIVFSVQDEKMLQAAKRRDVE